MRVYCMVVATQISSSVLFREDTQRFSVRTVLVDGCTTEFCVPVVGMNIQLDTELHLATAHRDVYHNNYITVFLRFVLL
ncbi:hypothetical protein HMPREF1033_01359 [Tannerella sp. 6_1_58FAA_CT1]|nr:hypothetical protein HMPREF1033_01359 [Tannerella sp. 6_1_58FAA_CT1]